MSEFVISERAEADLHEIWHHSFDNWGEAQADRYVDELDAGMGSAAPSQKATSSKKP